MGGKKSEDDGSQWLKWAQEMQALAQTGLAFSTGNYDTQRYQRFMEMAAEMVEKPAGEFIELHHREHLRRHFLVTPLSRRAATLL